MSARAALSWALMALALLTFGCGETAAPRPAAPPPPARAAEDLPPTCPETVRAEGEDATPLEGARIVLLCFRGVPRDVEPQLRARMREHEGGTFSSEAADKDLRALFHAGLVDDVRITAVPAGPSTVILDLDVKARARVAELTFHGADALGNAALASSFPVGKDAPLDLGKLRDALRALEGEYRDRGYASAHATFSVDSEPGAPVRLRIDVVEGPLVRVQSLAFTGLSKLSEADVAKVLREKVGDPYRPDWAERDVLLASAELYEHGLLNGKVEVRPTLAGAAATITFAVTEGPAFRLAKVHVKGVDLGPEKELLAGLQTRPKALFVRSKVLRDIEALRTRAAGRGLSVDITPSMELDPKKGTVDLTFDVTKR